MAFSSVTPAVKSWLIYISVNYNGHSFVLLAVIMSTTSRILHTVMCCGIKTRQTPLSPSCPTYLSEQMVANNSDFIITQLFKQEQNSKRFYLLKMINEISDQRIA